MSEKRLPTSPDGFKSSAPDEDPWAETVPASSRLMIHVDPADPVEMLNLQAFAFREELMHAERQKFGLTRNVALLKKQSRETLFSFLRNELTSKPAAKKIDRLLQTRDEIVRKQEPFLETVDQFLTHSVMRESGYLGEYASEFATQHERSETEVFEELESMQERLEKERIPDVGDKEVYDRLLEIKTDYNSRVSEAVADAALDVPYLIEPLDIEGYPSRPVDAIDLEARFDATVDAVRRLDLDPDDVERDNLVERLQETVNHPDVGDEGRSLRNIAIPLLDVPAFSFANDHTTQVGFRDIDESSSELGKVLNGVFRFVGSLGGAFYKLEQESSDDVPLMNWLVNPWIHDESISDGMNYAQLWQRAFIGDSILTQYYEIVEKPYVGNNEGVLEVSCPFCSTTRWEYCGGDKCQCMSYIDPARKKQLDFILEVGELNPSDN